MTKPISDTVPSREVMVEATKKRVEENKKIIKGAVKAPLQKVKPPVVFVPSKGRCWKKGSGTVQLLNEDGVRGVVVVEPGEAEEYRNWLNDSNLEVHVLDKNGMGVSYARNEILKIAPKDDWFWIIDDDVSAFYENTKEGAQLLDMKSVLRYATENERVRNDTKVAVLGLEYKMFSSGLTHRYEGHFIENSYCNVCCAYNISRLPPNIKFNFRVREDYDFVLQVIHSGRKSLRLAWLSFTCPSMGSNRGGMFDYYSVQQRACLAQRAIFAKKWARVCRPCVKSNRPDVKIHWSRLGKLMPLQREYLKKLEATSKKKNKTR